MIQHKTALPLLIAMVKWLENDFVLGHATAPPRKHEIPAYIQIHRMASAHYKHYTTTLTLDYIIYMHIDIDIECYIT